ncbi:putative uncharacterized protein [Firmicutes bacterium CAG:170]|nr:putative uncharacterized protein [Firmicutes bacterium CAG:170]
MICGGDVTVYYQILKPEELPFADALLEMLGSGENGWLLMKMDANASVRMGLYDERHGVRFLDGVSMEALRPMLLARAVYREGEESWYVEPVSRAGRVYIFGGGHVGRALVPVLAGVEFRVTVFDNRPDFAKQATARILQSRRLIRTRTASFWATIRTSAKRSASARRTMSLS